MSLERISQYDLTRDIESALVELGLSVHYKSPVKNYALYLEKTGLSVSVESFREFLIFLFNQVETGERSKATYNKTIVAVRRFLMEYLRASGAAQNEIDRTARLLQSKDFKNIKLEKAIDESEVLTPAELDEITAQAGPRTALIIELLRKTALRVGELVSIGVKNIAETNEGHYKINIIGKGKKERSIYISADLYSRINATFDGKTYLIETSSGRPYHPANIRKMVSRVGIKASKQMERKITVSNIHPHAMRHSWATNALEAGADLLTVSQYLGHASPETTAKYYLHTKPKADKILNLKV